MSTQNSQLDPSVPTEIGPFRLLRQLGSGGMGAVYEAVHHKIESQAAIKLLHAHVAHIPEISRRFFHEAVAVNRVGHPALVQIHDYGELGNGIPYLIMEFLRGETLRARLDRVPALRPNEAVQIARQVADALAATHARAIYHRDLKPDNVMLTPDSAMPAGERVKILDFGIAKLAEIHSRETMKTSPMTVLGTPAYMAPEQCLASASVNDRADVYALGVMLFEMLAGRRPFAGPGPRALLEQQICQPPPSIKTLVDGAPPALCALVMTMLEKEPARRPTMAAVTEALDALQLSQPRRAERVGHLVSPPSERTMHIEELSPALLITQRPEPSPLEGRRARRLAAVVLAGVVVAAIALPSAVGRLRERTEPKVAIARVVTSTPGPEQLAAVRAATSKQAPDVVVPIPMLPVTKPTPARLQVNKPAPVMAPVSKPAPARALPKPRPGESLVRPLVYF